MEYKKEQPDHAGLQTIPAHDAPEVVNDYPSRPLVQRHTSMNSPEAYTPIKNEKRRSYFGDQPEVRPHYGNSDEALADDDKKITNTSSQRNICGLRRKVFFWILAVIILVIVIAAVLGGVLASVLGGSTSSVSTGSSSSSGSSSGSLPSIESKSGLAVLKPQGSTTLYQYFQDSQGRIVENQYSNGQWSIQGDSVPSNAVIGTDAQSASPIAATSWTSNGFLFVGFLRVSGRRANS